jgi:hypothetical protein
VPRLEKDGGVVKGMRIVELTRRAKGVGGVGKVMAIA